MGGGRIWTIEGREDPEKDLMSLDEDEETRILLEKEFDDYYEDHVHKSAGPVVFVSKMLGMIPVIWTEDESESECKSYFNLYTFVIFIGKSSGLSFMVNVSGGVSRSILFQVGSA